eukprot:81907-Prorocentrum_minimum.AAC.2
MDAFTKSGESTSSRPSYAIVMDTPKIEEYVDDEYRWLQSKAVELGSKLNAVLCSRFITFLQVQEHVCIAVLRDMPVDEPGCVFVLLLALGWIWAGYSRRR